MRAVLSRSVRNPLVVGLGAGVVLIASGAPAAVAATSSPSPKTSTSSAKAKAPTTKATTPAASKTASGTAPGSAAPTPTQSKTTTPTPPPPKKATLRVGVTRLTSGTIHAGDVVKMNAAVTAGGNTQAADILLTLGANRGATVTPNCAESAGRCIVGGLYDHSQSVEFTVTVPTGVTGKVTISAASWADNVSTVTGSDSFTVAAPPKTKTTNTGSNTNTGTSSNVNNNTGTTTPNANLAPNTSTTAPPPATANSPVLPNMTPGTTPQTATMKAASEAATMKAAPASADQLTFSRLASTQAAFLMALLVAFGLLLTQLRLGRAPIKPTKPRGTHRRRPTLPHLLPRRSR
jgi:hypothetical protein